MGVPQYQDNFNVLNHNMWHQWRDLTMLSVFSEHHVGYDTPDAHTHVELAASTLAHKDHKVTQSKEEPDTSA